ncbi:MAG: hypothetical protein AB2A00_34770 [Myxococcota bacterium]
MIDAGPRPVGPEWPGAGTLFGGQPRRPWLWLGVIVVVSILTQGYTVGIINHGAQLPLIRHYAGETSFARDPFILDMAHTYTSALYPALGWLARFIPLEPLLFVLFLLFRVVNVVLAWRLALALWRDGHVALWTAAALSVQTLTFALDFISDIYLTHGALAQAMVLGALLLLARGRVVAAFLVGGLLFNVHSLHSTFVCGMMGLAVLAGPRRREQFTSLVVGSMGAVLLMLPTVYWMKQVGALGAPAPEGYAEALKAWFPGHFWLSTWGVSDWLRLVFPALAGLTLWRLAGPSDDDGAIARVATLSLVVGVLGGLLTEVWPNPTLIRLHPMRLSWLMTLAGAPYFIRACLQLLRHLERPDQPHARLAAATGTMTLLGLALPLLYRYAYWMTLLPALRAVVELVEDPARTRRLRVLMTASLLCALAVPAAMLASDATEYSGLTVMEGNLRRMVLVEGLIGAFAVATVVSAWMRMGAGPHQGFARRALLQSAVLLAAFHLVGRGALMVQYHRKGPIHDWKQVQHWAAENLPAGAVVLAPLNQIGFRSFSKQTPAVDFQEGIAITHNPQYLETYFHKLKLYGWEPGEIVGFSHYSRLEPLDANLKTEDALRLGKALGAVAAVRRTRQPAWDLPVLFRTNAYVVYRLDGPG